MTAELARREVQVGGERLTLDVVADFPRALARLRARLVAVGQEDRVAELSPHYGTLWPAALGLGQFLESLGRAGLGGRTLLELGCGLGLPSLIAARHGAIVTATDFHPAVEPLLLRNAALNGVETLAYRQLDWRRPDPELGRFDLVVTSDVLYDWEHAPVVAETIVRHLAPGGRALLADPGRGFLEHAVNLMERLGLDAELYTFSVADDNASDGRRDDVYLVSFCFDD